MPEFCSFLVFRPNEIELIHKMCAEAGWRSRDIEDPSTRYRFTENTRSQLAQASALEDIEIVGGQQYGRLLVLDCEEEEADNISQLIWAANLIVEGFPPEQSPPSCAFPLSDDGIKRREVFQYVFRTNGYFQRFIHRETMPVAVAVAVRAWPDRKLIYAIHKLAQSYQTESVTPGSMHPRNGRIFEKHTNDFQSHVGTSIAINLAYSAIEELGFAIGAHTNKPRSLSKNDFIWNPEVLEPLRERLDRAGIDPDRTVDWVARGDKTEVEIYEMLDEPTEYADGQEVRDRRVKLYDAINFCEYLRNRMTAHAFSGNTARLGPYEVYNTQQVARFLILAKSELWGVWLEDLHERYRATLAS
ncbi:hypothetical protein HTT03_09260 [Sulfitobacter sp. S0837]|uniref:hypothetical protein n=1 Tax=Sulfitobacter maritimus TaxID=2741719 RepID=UPI001581A7F4|nr:hypothetical protein [Sulfitobacter maritimus]NUH65473.1 hypothetical protein [Sulfitobacter maritimus]